MAVTKKKKKRAPVRRRFSWQAMAWVGAGVAVPLGVISLLVVSGVNHGAASPPTPTVAGGALAQGQPAPDFTAGTFDGRQLTLSGYQGHPVLLNFFASWCTQCAHELPFMEDSYRLHASSGFTIVGVNGLETGDGPGFYHRLGLTFPAVYDPGNPGKIAREYSVYSSLPVSVFIDRNGRVDLIQLGAITPALLEQEIQKLS